MKCNLYPTKIINGEEQIPHLFKSLFKEIKDRKKAAFYYYYLTSSAVLEKFSYIKKDEFGDLDFKSLNAILPIKEIVKQVPYEEVTSDIFNKTYNSEVEAENAASDYNSLQIADPYTQTLAEVKKEEKGKFKLQPVKKDDKSIQQFAQTKADRALYNKLEGFLASLGFAVERLKTKDFAGRFNAKNAKTNTEGLLQIVQLAEGERGTKALPEEVSHIIVAGLKHESTMQRLLNNLTLDMCKDILGDSYAAYEYKYKKEYPDSWEENIKEEVAGRILNSYIKQQSSSTLEHLLDRIINFIHSLLSPHKNTLQSYLYQHMEDAKMFDDYLKEIVNNLENKVLDKRINKEDILKSKILYSLTEEQEKAYQTLLLLDKRRKALLKEKEQYKIEEFKEEVAQKAKDLKKEIDKIEEAIERKEYALVYASFLTHMANTITDISESAFNSCASVIHFQNVTIDQLKHPARHLNQLSQYANAYTNILHEFLSNPKSLGIDLSDTDTLKNLIEQAGNVKNLVDNSTAQIEMYRKNILIQLVKNYIQEGTMITNEKGEVIEMTAEMLVTKLQGDATFFDKYFNAASTSKDPLVGIADTILSKQTYERDEAIQELAMAIRTYTEEFVDQGYSTDSIYERDEEGKTTGFFISDYNQAAFHKAKEEFLKHLEKKYEDNKRNKEMLDLPDNVVPELSDIEIKQAIQKELADWEYENTVEVPHPYLPNTTMRVPGPKYYTGAVENLSPAQRAYYDKIMSIKAKLDKQLGRKTNSLYQAPAILKNTTEALIDDGGDVSTVWEKLKRTFSIDEDSVEYGNRQIDLTFDNKRAKSVPIYFTHRLKNPSMISTDIVSTMIAYGGMVHNYTHMSKVSDLMDLLVEQTRTSKKYITGNTLSRIKGKLFNSEIEKEVGERNAYYQLKYLVDKIVYGEGRYLPENSSGPNLEQTVDNVRQWSSKVAMGFNLLSGLSNFSVGMISNTFHAFFGGDYGIKDFYKACKEYSGLLAGHIQGTYKYMPEDKLSLLIRKFDILEDYYEELNRDRSYKGKFARFMGKNSALPFIFNSAGEHAMRCTSFIATLKATKVYKEVDGELEEVSLYDALEIKDVVKDGKIIGKTLDFKGTYRDKEGNIISTGTGAKNFLFKVKQLGHGVNQSLHGAYSENDKGMIHKWAAGRLLMQFRQWMPAFFTKRFARKHYNAKLGREERGYHAEAYFFILHFLQDLRKGHFHFMTHYRALGEAEQRRVKQSFYETLFVLALFICSHILRGSEDDDEFEEFSAARKLATIVIRRLYLEYSAGNPFTTISFVSSNLRIIDDPIASANLLENIVDLIQVYNLGEEVQSGKYKGWDKYFKDVFEVLPYTKLYSIWNFEEDDTVFRFLFD